jgi:phosphate transport system permease protein
MISYRLFKSRLIGLSMKAISLGIIVLALMIGVGLYLKSTPLLHQQSFFQLIQSRAWKPFRGSFGFFPYLMGTLWVTSISIVIALPLCLLTAIYLTEYASVKIRSFMTPLIDLLSGIPSVVYGVWGVLVIVPIIGERIAPRFGVVSPGYSLLAGGIVLSIMIFPLLIGIFSEVLGTVPQELRDSSYSLGATKWQTIKKVVIRKSLPGILAAVVLAISRALGETIAVLMVCGNIAVVPHSALDAGYPLPALIANHYGEMMSIPLFDAALMLAAFLLFIVIFLFNGISRIVIARLERRML